MSLPLEILHRIYLHCDAASRGNLRCANSAAYDYLSSLKNVPLSVGRLHSLENLLAQEKWEPYILDSEVFGIHDMEIDYQVMKHPNFTSVRSQSHSWQISTRRGFDVFVDPIGRCEIPWCDICSDYKGSFKYFVVENITTVVKDVFDVLGEFTLLCIDLVKLC